MYRLELKYLLLGNALCISSIESIKIHKKLSNFSVVQSALSCYKNGN